MKAHSQTLSLVLLSALLSGCCSLPFCSEKLEEFPPAVVTKISTPIVIDGVLDEPAWSLTPEYELGQNEHWKTHECVRERKAIAAAPYETGFVRYTYDDKYLYVAFRFLDSDVYSECTDDQKMLISFGDTAELFLRPMKANHYWELYVGPHGNQTTFFYPCNGYQGIPSCFEKHLKGMKTAAKVYGVINEHKTEDQCWTAEMAIPLEFFAQEGTPFEPGEPWSIMTARYNPSYFRPYRQFSSYPKMPIYSFHMVECYAPVIFK